MPPWAAPVCDRGGIELADDRDVGLAGHLDRRHKPGAAGADNHRIEAVIPHGADSLKNGT